MILDMIGWTAVNLNMLNLQKQDQSALVEVLFYFSLNIFMQEWQITVSSASFVVKKRPL